MATFPISNAGCSTAVNLHIDLAVPNFGIQAGYPLPERTRDIFTGISVIQEGKLRTNAYPRLGIDIDEPASTRNPFLEQPLNGAWTAVRLRDGTVQRP